MTAMALKKKNNMKKGPFKINSPTKFGRGATSAGLHRNVGHDLKGKRLKLSPAEATKALGIQMNRGRGPFKMKSPAKFFAKLPKAKTTIQDFASKVSTRLHESRGFSKISGGRRK